MKIVKRQSNSKMCLICGVDNQAGLKAPFYELEDGRVVSVFRYEQIHQSYPERAHGGMITCMLDEIAGRTVWCSEPRTLAVTATINVRFVKPVPLEEKLFAVGVMKRNTKRLFYADAALYDAHGTLLAQAETTYFKMPSADITSADMDAELDVTIVDGVTEIELPF